MAAGTGFFLLATGSASADDATGTTDPTGTTVTGTTGDPATDPATDPTTGTDPTTDPTTDPPPATDPVVDPPVTDPPVTDPPVVDPPVTDPPVTDPPVTDPPVTDPPVTDPVVDPPVTDPPVTDPVVDPPVTDPVTDPPVTDPPVTDPVVDPPVTDPGTVPVVTPPLTDPATPPAVLGDGLPADAALGAHSLHTGADTATADHAVTLLLPASSTVATSSGWGTWSTAQGTTGSPDSRAPTRSRSIPNAPRPPVDPEPSSPAPHPAPGGSSGGQVTAGVSQFFAVAQTALLLLLAAGLAQLATGASAALSSRAAVVETRPG